MECIAVYGHTYVYVNVSNPGYMVYGIYKCKNQINKLWSEVGMEL